MGDPNKTHRRSFVAITRQQARERKGKAPRKAHLQRLKEVSGRRTRKHQRRVAHREKMSLAEIAELLPELAAGADDADDDDAPVPLPHQAKALAESLVAAKGGRVKGRARKMLKVAGLDPKRGLPGKGKAARAIAEALAARDAAAAAGNGGGGGGGAATSTSTAGAAADAMEE